MNLAGSQISAIQHSLEDLLSALEDCCRLGRVKHPLNHVVEEESANSFVHVSMSKHSQQAMDYDVQVSRAAYMLLFYFSSAAIDMANLQLLPKAQESIIHAITTINGHLVV